VDTLKAFMEQRKTIVFVSHAPDAVRTICQRTCVLDYGELVFDGDVESGLAFYDQLLGHGPAHPAAVAALPLVVEASLDEAAAGARPDDADTAGTGWMLEFLRGEGLQPHHRVLYLSAPAQDGDGAGLASFLDGNQYTHLTDSAGLFDLPAGVEEFDFAVVESLFSSLPFNRVARSIAGIVRRLKPSGRFYATWFENPDPADFEPITHANGLTTYPDREPYHYPFSLVVNVCDALGATVERLSNPTHPGASSVLVISRRLPSRLPPP
jgi:hypothetical protein